MPPEDIINQTGQVPGVMGTPGGMATPQEGMPSPGAAPMEGMGEGNPEAEYEQVVAQMPQEERDRIVQMFDQSPESREAIIEEYMQKLLQLPDVGEDEASALNLATNLVIKVLVHEMAEKNMTFSELCPNLAREMEQQPGAQPEQPMGQPMGQPQPTQPMVGQPVQQPAPQQPMPSILGGGR